MGIPAVRYISNKLNILDKSVRVRRSIVYSKPGVTTANECPVPDSLPPWENRQKIRSDGLLLDQLDGIFHPVSHATITEFFYVQICFKNSNGQLVSHKFEKNQPDKM